MKDRSKPIPKRWNRNLSMGLLAIKDMDREVLALCMEIVAISGEIDVAHIQMASTLLDAEFLVTCEMLLAIESQASRRAVIDSIAREKLDETDHNLYRRLKRAMKPVRDLRNDIAHGTMLHLAQYADRLVLLPPSVIARERAKSAAVREAWQRHGLKPSDQPTREQWEDIQRVISSGGDRTSIQRHARVYSKDVLRYAIGEARKVHEMIGLFTYLVLPPPGSVIARPRLEAMLPQLPK